MMMKLSYFESVTKHFSLQVYGTTNSNQNIIVPYLSRKTVAIAVAINKHVLPKSIMASSITTAAMQLLQTQYAIIGSCPIYADW